MRVNVPPKVWGSCAWTFLDACAVGVDSQSSAAFSRFLELLPEVLPCEQCRKHAGAYLASHPIRDREPRAWLQAFRAAVEKRKAGEGGKGAAGCNCAGGAAAPAVWPEALPAGAVLKALLVVLALLVLCAVLGQWCLAKRSTTYSAGFFARPLQG
jgi:hypothetical protein